MNYWCKEKYWEADNRIWWNIPKPFYNFWDNRIQYNQNVDWYESWCVFHAWLWCLSDQTWIDFTLEKIKKLANLCKNKYWRKEWEWMFINSWADAVVEWYNNIYKSKIYKYIVKTWSQEENDLLDLWYSIHNWYRWNYKYNSDKNDDCILQGDDFWDTTYWHSIRKVKKKDKIYIVDNYEWIKCNIYEIQDYLTKCDHWLFFGYSYVYIFKTPMENTITVPYYKWENMEEKETIYAWVKECDKNDYNFSNYEWKVWLIKMVTDIAIKRSKK